MLETPRLILRRWREEDVAPMAAVNADPEVMRWIRDGSVRDEQQTRGGVQAWESEWESQGFGLFAQDLGAAVPVPHATRPRQEEGGFQSLLQHRGRLAITFLEGPSRKRGGPTRFAVSRTRSLLSGPAGVIRSPPHGRTRRRCPPHRCGGDRSSSV
ncbi:GNAT family N-acetyltransferase [Streptomyces nigrescens]